MIHELRNGLVGGEVGENDRSSDCDRGASLREGVGVWAGGVSAFSMHREGSDVTVRVIVSPPSLIAAELSVANMKLQNT